MDDFNKKNTAEFLIKDLKKLETDKKIEFELINENVLELLDINIDTFSEYKKKLYLKNFIHLMSQVIEDIRLINGRIEQYKLMHQKCENNKSNAMEYYRRKLEYFCKINQTALSEIIVFLHHGLKDYLIEKEHYDTFYREQKEDRYGVFFRNNRYNVALFPDYYDMSFDFSTVVKVSYIPNVKLIDRLNVEKEFLSLRKESEDKYFEKLHDIVEQENLLENILYLVKNNYYSHKRTEIFEDMILLFEKKHYQSFISLGLLQLEGLFYDLCKIKFGEKENMGTLVEKVQKSLQGKNEISFMRFYPYFAFDVPIRRNEIAHKGMLDSSKLEDDAYDLILDLNTVMFLVKLESYDKFTSFFIIYDEMVKSKAKETDLSTENEIYFKLLEELCKMSIIVDEYFWSVLKNPENYEEELDFYNKDDLDEGYISIKEVVYTISRMVRNKKFWAELLKLVSDSVKESHVANKKLIDFAKRLKNEYIAELKDEAKEYCVEIAKLIQ
ncbi:hypothetical protein MKD14_15475 [[Clostridium] innocuum]|nr:hypothetical protein [[Clostridium] innocuum]